MSNTGENAELVEQFKTAVKTTGGIIGMAFIPRLFKEAAAALAAADARIAELERWKRLQAEDIMTLGREVGVQIERAETAETLLDEAHTSIAQMRESLVETQIQSYGWMEAHDKLKAGKPYKFPSPADKPDILQALEEARRALAPFIKLADNVFSDGKNATVADEVTLWCFNNTDITFGDLRRIRATHDRIGKSNVEGEKPTLLEEARMVLEWALADMNGEAKYDNPLQRIACEDRARATLDRIGK